ncbi:hypothetical protein AURDEDRAFT_115337 [Auricularia subglabra TFB-10046 SS5]|nr:hypothetical protein AURDEDRAFT_115337 [Auricularia subglabra TFB-10046 SS5]
MVYPLSVFSDSEDEDNVQYPTYRDDHPHAEHLVSGYYYDDDGVALLVGNVVYKIARSRLVQDSPVFRDMFALGDGTTGDFEGTLNKPVVLGDTDVVAFEDYLWILHERTPAVEKFTRSEANYLKFRRLLHIALLTHKYRNAALYSWAIGHCYRILASRAVPLFEPFVGLVIAVINLLRPGGRTRAAFEAAVMEYLDGKPASTSSTNECSRSQLLQNIDVVALMGACDTHGLGKLATETRYALLRIHTGALRNLDPRLTAPQLRELRAARLAMHRRWARIRVQLATLGQRYNVRFACLQPLGAECNPCDLRTLLDAILPHVEAFCGLPRVAEPDRRIRDIILRERKTLRDHLELYFECGAPRA